MTPKAYPGYEYNLNLYRIIAEGTEEKMPPGRAAFFHLTGQPLAAAMAPSPALIDSASLPRDDRSACRPARKSER